MKKLTEPMKQLAATLGRQYTLIYIDDAWCLYRDLGNGYDIAVNMGKQRKSHLVQRFMCGRLEIGSR